MIACEIKFPGKSLSAEEFWGRVQLWLKLRRVIEVLGDDHGLNSRYVAVSPTPSIHPHIAGADYKVNSCR